MLLKQFHQNLIETFYQPKCWEIVIMTHQNVKGCHMSQLGHKTVGLPV